MLKFLSRACLGLFIASGSACAPVMSAGPPIALPPGLQATAQVGSISFSSDWLRSTEDFADTFIEEVREELGRCMQGASPVDVRIHLDDLDRADRVETLLRGRGEHEISGTVEFVDPRRGVVMGRIPVSAKVHDPGGVAGLLSDRQMVASEAFGRATCESAFGRNPRDPGLHNATSD